MKLQAFRESLHFTKKDMAKEIGVSASYYYKVESGQLNPSYEFMRKLKNRFPRVNIDQLFFNK